jgi:hypothetical protein
MNVINTVAVKQPRNSLKIFLIFEAPIFHAATLAMKFAKDPNAMSVIALGMGLAIFATAPPIVTPKTAGHPKTIDNGIKASATRTWTIWKLIPAKARTRTAYNAAKTAVRAIALLSNFTFSPPTPGFITGGTGGGPLTRHLNYAKYSALLSFAFCFSFTFTRSASPR